MSINPFERKKDWTPPPRPEWVTRINEEGSCMDARAIVPLDETSLLNSAMQSTGLSDFGGDDWREPFQIFIKSLEDDAELNFIGRIRTRSEILQFLCARLMIEDEYKKHPEIEDEEIKQPLVVIGQSRSGTSYLLNLLSACPDNGVIKTWEAIFPCPPPESASYETDPRIEQGHQLIDQWNRVTPEHASMHESSGTIPEECVHIMSLNFMSLTYLQVLGQVSSYVEYAVNLDWTLAYKYHKRVLKLLQWKNPRKHWALKAPEHLDHLPELLKVYPDACIIFPHRDPIKALASGLSLIGTAQWGRTDQPLKSGSFDFIMSAEAAAQRLEVLINWFEQGVVDKGRVCNVLYNDLVAKPFETISTIYNYFDLDLTKENNTAIHQYILDNPRDNRPSHKFSVGTDAIIEHERKVFKRYQTYFNIPNEV